MNRQDFRLVRQRNCVLTAVRFRRAPTEEDGSERPDEQ